jgi:hypothetical protein
MQLTYARPTIVDYGTLEELTAACLGVGATDEVGKTFNVPFLKTNPVGQGSPPIPVCGITPSDIRLKRDIRPI